MIELRDELRLPPEPLTHASGRNEARAHDLDGEIAPAPLVADRIDGGEPASAQFADDAELRPQCRRQPLGHGPLPFGLLDPLPALHTEACVGSHGGAAPLTDDSGHRGHW